MGGLLGGDPGCVGLASASALGWEGLTRDLVWWAMD